MHPEFVKLIDFNIDPKNRLIEITQKGSISINLLADTLKKIRDHEHFDHRFDLLNDCREYIGPKTEDERQALMEILLEHGPKPPMKQALVVAPEEEINAAMLYSSKPVKENCAHTVIFQNLDAAKMWLGIKVDKKIDDIINDGLWAN